MYLVRLVLSRPPINSIVYLAAMLRLAREPPAHNVNESTPRLSIECSDIIPDWELWQDSVSLAL